MKIGIQSQANSKKDQLINLLRITLFAGVALWLFGGIGHTIDLVKYYNAENWSKVKVKIIESNISVFGIDVKTCSSPNIKYTYELEGQKQTSNKWGFSFFNCSSSDFAREVTSKYRVGTEVYAYVNKNSGNSILEINRSALWIVTLIGFGCCIGVWIIRPNKKITSNEEK